jgi:hypothetical protein
VKIKSVVPSGLAFPLCAFLLALSAEYCLGFLVYIYNENMYVFEIKVQAMHPENFNPDKIAFALLANKEFFSPESGQKRLCAFDPKKFFFSRI